MKPEYEDIWKNLHVVRHERFADDPVLFDCGKIIYQYMNWPLYVAVFYFDEDDCFTENTTYFLTSEDEDPLSVQEYYDLSKEEIAQEIIAIILDNNEQMLPKGLAKYDPSISENDLRELAAQCGLDYDNIVGSYQDLMNKKTEQDEDEQDEDEYWQYEYEQDEDEQDKDGQYEDEQDSTEQDEDEQDDADIKYGW